MCPRNVARLAPKTCVSRREAVSGPIIDNATGHADLFENVGTFRGRRSCGSSTGCCPPPQGHPASRGEDPLLRAIRGLRQENGHGTLLQRKCWMGTKEKDILEALSDLAARISNLSEQISSLEERFGSFDEQLSRMQKSIKSLGGQIENLADDLPS